MIKKDAWKLVNEFSREDGRFTYREMLDRSGFSGITKIDTRGRGKQFWYLDGSILGDEDEVRMTFSWVYLALGLGKDF